jgi:hypothetical protein
VTFGHTTPPGTIGLELIKVVSWYDDEWGSSSRLVELAEREAAFGRIRGSSAYVPPVSGGAGERTTPAPVLAPARRGRDNRRSWGFRGPGSGSGWRRQRVR